MRENIFAYTALGTYPEFISVNREGDGPYEIIVRSPKKVDGSCGEMAQVSLDKKEMLKLANVLAASLLGKKKV